MLPDSSTNLNYLVTQDASKLQISWIIQLFLQKCAAGIQTSDPLHGRRMLYHWATMTFDAKEPKLVNFILLSKKPQNWFKSSQIIANTILYWIYIILDIPLTFRGAVTPNIRWCAALFVTNWTGHEIYSSPKSFKKSDRTSHLTHLLHEMSLKLKLQYVNLFL